jgi:ring-1,2-phenylacetyl-CoA epoxidase subunit PaaE
MIFSLQRWMEKRGIEKRRIHFELFSVPGQNKSESVPESKREISNREGVSKVTVRSDGTSFTFDLSYEGDSVLDAAIRQGADLPFSCKGGVCATCRARLIEGKVEMDTNFALEPDELANGYILTCQSHPRTSHLIVDFDRTG